MSGRFPGRDEADPPRAPLTVIRCQSCGLIQLLHTVDPCQLYTKAYGYRSGINNTMRGHLAGIVGQIRSLVRLSPGDVVLDIGCNDGTLLSNYSDELVRVGIDPLAKKFEEGYPRDFITVASYFSAAVFGTLMPGWNASAITSIAMFYDLEDPGGFVADIAAVLADDGVWVLEQSYMPRMLAMNSYDTICHEHLEYYGLAQIERLLERYGLRVFDVVENDINGGSFRLFVCHAKSHYAVSSPSLTGLRDFERRAALDSQAPFDAFRERCTRLRDELYAFIKQKVDAGRRVHIYGASTKGNTILQYCGLDKTLIEAAADRNPEKWGLRTPGTEIPIISEEESRAMQPDYFLALPWHFREEFLRREVEFTARGGKFIFPLPKVEIV